MFMGVPLKAYMALAIIWLFAFVFFARLLSASNQTLLIGGLVLAVITALALKFIKDHSAEDAYAFDIWISSSRYQKYKKNKRYWRESKAASTKFRNKL